jgi:methionine-R-sulfoxide reductase
MKGTRITSDEKTTVSTYVGLIVVTALIVGGIYFFILSQKETKQVVGFDPNQPIPSDSSLRRRLKGEAYHVVRENGTQMPFQNEFWNNERPGLYVDVITNEPLFASVDKYDAGLGMPTFTKPIADGILAETLDTSHDMQRTEVRAKRSNAHLGHVFPEPQSPTGKRYTVNSAAFHFIPVEQMKQEHYDGYLPLFEKKPGAP